MVFMATANLKRKPRLSNFESYCSYKAANLHFFDDELHGFMQFKL